MRSSRPVQGIAHAFLAAAETVRELVGRADMQRWIEEPDREVRGQRMLSLLAHAGFPELAESAQVWIRCDLPFPDGLKETITALAQRQTEFDEAQRQQRELELRRRRVPVAVMLNEARLL